MKRVTGFGGIFFKCDNQENVRQWYQDHLGIESGSYGAEFKWRDIDNPDLIHHSLWSTFKKDTEYFTPSTKDFMINYIVDNLEMLVEKLKTEGIEIIGKIEEYDFGKFAWIIDPEGNKIELWEPAGPA